MKLIKNISRLAPIFSALLLLLSVTAVGNPIDSDLSNTAGTNSGTSLRMTTSAYPSW